MKRGLFGGSFNPIHNGHLHLAQTVKTALALDEIVLMPAGIPPHKSAAAYATPEHRLAMCRLAAEGLPWLTVSDDEIRKNGKSYTVETLRGLQAAQPEDDWTLLIGSDMLLSFSEWFCWQEILQRARVAVVSRTTGDLQDLQQKADALLHTLAQAGLSGEICVLSVRALPVSSTQIRENVQKNVDCSCLLPESVVKYMERYGLYRTL